MGPLTRLSSGHTVDEARRLAGGSRATDRSEEGHNGQSEVRVRKLGSLPAPASWRVHRCGGQDAQEQPASTYSLSEWCTSSGIAARQA